MFDLQEIYKLIKEENPNPGILGGCHVTVAPLRKLDDPIQYSIYLCLV
jgi:hypothetical protein